MLSLKAQREAEVEALTAIIRHYEPGFDFEEALDRVFVNGSGTAMYVPPEPAQTAAPAEPAAGVAANEPDAPASVAEISAAEPEPERPAVSPLRELLSNRGQPPAGATGEVPLPSMNASADSFDKAWDKFLEVHGNEPIGA